VTAERVKIVSRPAAADGVALAVHGGAGERPEPLSASDEQRYHDGLRRALAAGRTVLRDGGSALDAACAAVMQLEDDELFNAGRGAALTSAGTAELDAAVMRGDGAAGAVAGCRTARNPVLAARAVLERTNHVLIADPPPALLDEWGLTQVDRDYFVTEPRRQELARVQQAHAAGTRHGTVGAVARDGQGRLAAATSTGGMTDQLPGRIGDAPIVGAGTFARDSTVAVSCTGQGEYFLRGVVAYDVSARLAYLGADLDAAVHDTIEHALAETGGHGGLIAAGRDGAIVLAYNSAAMFGGYLDGEEPVTFV
jgi:beta-aspartyl-peptidase (threonine type)